MSDLQNKVVSAMSSPSDIDSFNSLFKQHYFALLNYCKGYVQDECVAKDILQDSFVSLWEKRHRLHPNTNMKFYLFSVIKNKSINYLKHKKIELQYSKDKKAILLETEMNLTAIAYDGSDFLIAKELNAKIEKTMLELPKRCRDVIFLSRRKELKNKEIADQLSISIKTVESQMTKALKYLREKIIDNL